jgi:hypothetical protein
MTTPEVKTILTAEDRTAEAFRQMSENAKAAVDKVNSSFETMKHGIEAAFVGVSIGGAAQFVTSMAEAGERIEKMAQKAGVGGDTMARFGYLAKIADIDLEQLSTGIARMQRALVESEDGTSRASKAFHTLGLSISDLRRLEPDKQFEAIADAIRKVDDPAVQAAVAQEIFGRGGAALLPILKEGADGIRRLTDEYRGFAGALTDEDVKRLSQTSEDWKRLKAAAEALSETLVSKLAPSLTATFTAMRAGLSNSEELDLEVQIGRLQGLMQHNVTDPTMAHQREQQLAELQLRLNALRAPRDVAAFDSALQERLDSQGSVTVFGKRWSEQDQRRYESEQQRAERAQQQETLRGYHTQDAATSEFGKWLRDTETEVEKAQRKFQDFENELIDLESSGQISDNEAAKRWWAAWDKFNEIDLKNKMKKELKAVKDDAQQYGDQAADALTNAFASFFDGTTKGLGGLVRSFAKAFEKIAAEAAANKIVDLLFSSSEGGAGGFFASIFSSLGFAEGGDPPVGKASWVGERGRELFVPKEAGTVIPAGAAGGITIHSSPVFNIDSRSDRAQIANDVGSLVQQSNRQLVATLLRYNPGLKV